MSHAREMLDTHPGDFGFPAEELAAAIDACFASAQTCIACADACLAEEDVAGMRRCISLDHNCADLCLATGRVLSRQTDYEPLVTQAALAACVRACAASAEECEKHADHHDHCRICAENSRACVAACQALLADEAERELQDLRGG